MQPSHVQRAVDLPAAAGPYRRLLGRHNLRLLWLGEGISLVGDQLHLVALTWLVLDITGSATTLGSILAVAMLARATCLLPSGVVVDRLSPGRVLVAINGLRALVGATLTALVALDALAVWHLYAFSLAFGALDALFQPAYLALPPLLVASDELPPANALLQGTRRACEMLGPALGGVLLKISGAGAAFGADAVSFAIAAALFASIPVDELHRHSTSATFRSPGSPWQRVVNELVLGLSAVGRDHVLRILVLAVAVVNLMVAGPLAVGLPVLARTRFAADPLAFGLLFSAFGGGALVGTVLAGLPRRSERWWQWITGAIGMFGVCFLGISGAPNAQLAAGAVALTGIGVGFVLVLIFTRFQQQSAVAMRGRMMSVLVGASLACAALSNALAGVIATHSAAFLFAGTGVLLLFTMAGFGLSRTIRTIS